jgi:hypothetical protein
MRLDRWHLWWKREGAAELRALVWAHWDPIGLRDEDSPRDEYDAYLGPIASNLRQGADAVAIARLLDGFAVDNMGSSTNPARSRAAADAIVGWYQEAMGGEDSAVFK